ncbi:MAG: parallel beta-helix domain-containing protein, partial [Polyangiales bacterium]
GGMGGSVARDCTDLAPSTGMYSVQGAPATPTGDCTTTLNPSGGDDTEALTIALEDALSGDIICLGIGTFDVRGTLFVSNSAQITLKGIGPTPNDVILDYASAPDGDGIEVTTPGFTIENLWIKNTPKDSVVVRADDPVFRKLFVTWDAGSVLENGKYGIFPRAANNVLIEFSEVIGASDAGIYVGQCIGGIVRNNKAVANVAGIEIENSQDVEVYDNEAYDNTAGVLAFQLPGLSLEGDNVLLRDNEMYCNNRANFAAEGSIVAVVPAGTGALIAAGKNFEFRNNVIESNNSVGIIIASLVLFCQLEEERPDCLTGWPDGYDPYPTKMYLNGNTFINNGQDPQETLGLIADLALMVGTLEDVQWDGYIDPAVTDPEICIGETDVPTFRDYSENQCGTAAGLFGVGDCFGTNSTTSTAGHLCTLPELTIP